MFSDSVTVKDGDWDKSRIYFQYAPGGYRSKSALVDTLKVSELSKEINERGNVEVYFKTPTSAFSNADLWYSLPTEFLDFTSSFYYNVDYSYQVGRIILYYYYLPNGPNASTPNLDNADLPDYRFKYVLTAPKMTKSVEEAGINWENHDAVMGFLENESSIMEK